MFEDVRPCLCKMSHHNAGIWGLPDGAFSRGKQKQQAQTYTISYKEFKREKKQEQLLNCDPEVILLLFTARNNDERDIKDLTHDPLQ